MIDFNDNIHMSNITNNKGHISQQQRKKCPFTYVWMMIKNCTKHLVVLNSKLFKFESPTQISLINKWRKFSP